MSIKIRSIDSIALFLAPFLVMCALSVSAQDSLLVAIERSSEDSVRLELLIELADNYSRSDSSNLAGQYYREAITLATSGNYLRYKAIALDKLGSLVRRTGLYDQSLAYHQEAMEIATALEDKHLLASIYDHIGVVYRRKTDDNLALKYHLMALTTAEEIQDKRTIAYSCNSIGIIYTYQNNYKEALEYFDRALLLAQRHDNQNGIAINLNCIAWVHERQEKYDLAISYYERSLEVNEASGNREGMAICYNDLGKLYRTMGEYEKSLEYYRKTLDINESQGDLLHMATNRINLGPMPELYRTMDLWGKYDLICMNIYPQNLMFGFSPGEVASLRLISVLKFPISVSKLALLTKSTGKPEKPPFIRTVPNLLMLSRDCSLVYGARS